MPDRLWTLDFGLWTLASDKRFSRSFSPKYRVQVLTCQPLTVFTFFSFNKRCSPAPAAEYGRNSLRDHCLQKGGRFSLNKPLRPDFLITRLFHACCPQTRQPSRGVRNDCLSHGFTRLPKIAGPALRLADPGIARSRNRSSQPPAHRGPTGKIPGSGQIFHARQKNPSPPAPLARPLQPPEDRRSGSVALTLRVRKPPPWGR